MDQKVLMYACSAAFAWICCADGEISPIETATFVNLLCESDYVNEENQRDIEFFYQDVIDAFRRDFKIGKDFAQGRIEPIKRKPSLCKDVIAYARKAIIADHILNEQEELAIKEIAKLLGVQEESFDS